MNKKNCRPARKPLYHQREGTRDPQPPVRREGGIIDDALSSGDQKAAKVLFAGFGTFERRTRAPRVGTNPATGKPLNIPEKQFVSFKPGKTLKERIAALK